MYIAGEVNVPRACCERATQPYSLGEGGTIFPGSRPAGYHTYSENSTGVFTQSIDVDLNFCTVYTQSFDTERPLHSDCSITNYVTLTKACKIGIFRRVCALYRYNTITVKLYQNIVAWHAIYSWFSSGAILSIRKHEYEFITTTRSICN